MTKTPTIVYVSQAHLPITYIQLHFSIHHDDLKSLIEESTLKKRMIPQSSALRILTQRQLQRGTLSMERATFVREVENLGTEIQLTHRAYSHSIGAVVLTRTLGKFIDLLHQAITEPAFNPKELAQSKRAFISELEAKYDDDQSLAWLWLLRRIYLNHSLWNDYSITPQHVKSISLDDVQQAWPLLFKQNRFLASLTSNESRERLNSLIDPIYKSLCWGDNNKLDLSSSEFQPSTLSSLPRLTKTNLTLVHKSGKQQAILFIAHPTIEPNHPQALALYVALCALGGTFSAPLMQEIRNKRGLSYGAHAGIKGEAQSRFVCLHCSPEAPQAAEALLVMIEVYQRGGKGQLSDDEILFAKNYLINAHPFSIETPAMRAGLSANAKLMGIDPSLIFTQAERIQKLSPKQIRQAAQDQLADQQLEILVFGDQDQISEDLESRLRTAVSVERVIKVEAKGSPEQARP